MYDLKYEKANTMDERIKGSILEKEPPPVSDFVNRVRFCAKALAYGAVNDLWEPRIIVRHDGWSQSGASEYGARFNYYFNGKVPEEPLDYVRTIYTWSTHYPRISFLESFDYVEHIDKSRPDSSDMLAFINHYDAYLLTSKAFELLETPLTPPKIFISYRRGVSTVLGLLIESRLKALSSDLHPFIDKELTVGQP